MSYAHAVPLNDLHARLDAIVDGRDGASDGWSAHAAVLDRLAVNRCEAETHGWTSCALELDSIGHFRMFGLPPASCTRTEVPDLATLPDDEAPSPDGGAPSARRW